MAVFCLAVLLVVLGIAALLSLPQWGEDSVIPEVSVVPESGIGLDDAVAVPPSQRLLVAPGRPVVEGPRLAASTAAGIAGGAEPQTGLAAARVVVVSSAPLPVEAVPSPAPGSLPASQPTPAPVTTPVSAPSPPPASPAAPTRPLPGDGSELPPNPAGPGSGGGIVSGSVQIYEDDEYAYSFSFYAQPSAYRGPGEDNLILRFADAADENHSLGLQLWDDDSGNQRGLWASGDAMGGERFLAPLTEGAWHEVVLYFQASSEGDGLYLLLLDGEPIDTRAWVSLIDSAGGYGLLEAGLFRDGERVSDSPEIVFGPARLGKSLESVLP